MGRLETIGRSFRGAYVEVSLADASVCSPAMDPEDNLHLTTI
jgi:hypothetical protein